MWLNKRDSSIMIRLIELYISVHKPISSKQLAPIMGI